MKLFLEAEIELERHVALDRVDLDYQVKIARAMSHVHNLKVNLAKQILEGREAHAALVAEAKVRGMEVYDLAKLIVARHEETNESLLVLEQKRQETKARIRSLELEHDLREVMKTHQEAMG